MVRTKSVPSRRTGFMSLNTEILLLSALGISTTLMETALFSVKENVVKVWELDLNQFHLSAAHQNILKSVICGIVLVRGVTSHLYLASYLLLLYPVIMERLRVMMLFWMLVSGIRSLMVNGTALATGCVLCSTHGALAPTCFEFIAFKAAELACSAYMWVSVNDLYHQLKRRSFRSANQVLEINQQVQSEQEVEWSDSSSSESEEWSLPQSFLEELGEKNVDTETSEGPDVMASKSVDSVLAQAMVDWFCKKVLQLKKKGEIPGGKPDIDSEKYKSLQSRIRKSIATIDPDCMNRGAALRWLTFRTSKSMDPEEREVRVAEDIVSVWSSRDQVDEATRISCRRRNATDTALRDLLGIRNNSDNWPSGSVLFGGGSDSKLLSKTKISYTNWSSTTVDTAMQEVLSRLITVLCQSTSFDSLDLQAERSLHDMHRDSTAGRRSGMIWQDAAKIKEISPQESLSPPLPSPPISPEKSPEPASPQIPATPTTTPLNCSESLISRITVDASVQTLPPSGALLRKLDYAAKTFTPE